MTSQKLCHFWFGIEDNLIGPLYVQTYVIMGQLDLVIMGQSALLFYLLF